VTQDERDLLVWLAAKIAGMSFTDRRHEAPWIEQMIHNIRFQAIETEMVERGGNSTQRKREIGEG
jgi:frataxin-like iron-binding protein CyaY